MIELEEVTMMEASDAAFEAEATVYVGGFYSNGGNITIPC
jgi:hypothetical protein